MKKLLLTLMLGLMAAGAGMAQKSYVSMFVDLGSTTGNWVTARLTGDVPAGMKNYYQMTYDHKSDGDLLNELAANGFTVERVTGIGDGSQALILLSRVKDDDSGVPKLSDVAGSGSVEIARYNLQGVRVDADEPGLQIIVYSDYTARVVVNN